MPLKLAPELAQFLTLMVREEFQTARSLPSDGDRSGFLQHVSRLLAGAQPAKGNVSKKTRAGELVVVGVRWTELCKNGWTTSFNILQIDHIAEIGGNRCSFPIVEIFS